MNKKKITIERLCIGYLIFGEIVRYLVDQRPQSVSFFVLINEARRRCSLFRSKDSITDIDVLYSLDKVNCSNNLWMIIQGVLKKGITVTSFLCYF